MNKLIAGRKVHRLAWLFVGAATCMLLTGLSFNENVSSAQAGEVPPTESPYIEVVPGRLPLLVLAGHGGDLAPDFIPDRQQAVTINDRYSQAAARELVDIIGQLAGQSPSLVVNHLDRSKLDPNRSLGQGAQGDPTAGSAWRSFHESIDTISSGMMARCNGGLIIDLHSYGGPPTFIQFGYGLEAEALRLDDEELSSSSSMGESSIRALSGLTSLDLADLVRGRSSLGGRLQAAGYGAVPSPAHPAAFEGYLSGGYTLYRHGSNRPGQADAIQLELPYLLLQPDTRPGFMMDIGQALLDYLVDFYQLRLLEDGSYDCSAFSDVAGANWASRSIQRQFEAGLAVPCALSPRRFCPDRWITRGDAARWLWQALGPRSESQAGLVVFADVTRESEPIQNLWQKGIVDTCRTEPLRFCPGNGMSRAQMAGWLLRAKYGPGVVPAKPSGMFLDIAKEDWSSWWVEQAYREGLLRPCSSRLPLQLCPQQMVTRAEWAWAVDHVLNDPNMQKSP